MFRHLARTLRSHGYDAVSCHEAGQANRSIPDDEQLAYAAQSSRAILTRDQTDFLRLDAAWKSSGRAHAGIVIARYTEFGDLLRRVERHLNTCAPEIQHNTLLWLDPSPTR